MFKVDLRCPRCFRKDMRRNDGSYTPHKRVSGDGVMVQCVGYTRPNATRSPINGSVS